MIYQLTIQFPLSHPADLEIIHAKDDEINGTIFVVNSENVDIHHSTQLIPLNHSFVELLDI